MGFQLGSPGICLKSGSRSAWVSVCLLISCPAGIRNDSVCFLIMVFLFTHNKSRVCEGATESERPLPQQVSDSSVDELAGLCPSLDKVLQAFLLLAQNGFDLSINPPVFKYLILTFLAFVFQTSYLNIFFRFKIL